MRSFGRAFLAAAALASSVPSGGMAAQDPADVYTELQARERELRRELDRAPQLRAQPPGDASTALLGRLRDLVGRYEALARRSRQADFGDNALWQGAVLAGDAFWQFGDATDRATAVRLFELLESQHPRSPLASGAAGHLSRLEGVDRRLVASTLTSIRREVLPEVLRITLELEQEAIFREERLDAPSRVFVDLQNTRPVAALTDAALSFPDDVVRQARIGMQPDNRTRVVFDLERAARHSVYSLYNPYRIVIDFERVAPPTSARPVAPTSESGVAPTTAGAIAPTTARPVAPTSGGALAPTSESAMAPASDKPPAPPAAASNSGRGLSLSRQLGLGISRIVVDPGHGGHDPGARVRGLTEAELVLDVALRLERLLLKAAGVEVALTRRTNAFVALEERTAIANRAADLFLSIHANASEDARARGIETYFLNFAPNPEAEALAARENAGSSRTMGHLPDILKAIALNNKLDESRDFAAMLQSSLSERLRKIDPRARNLGVKQAPFMVLIGAAMPSALTEISFLTNRDEAALLRTVKYRQHIAEALAEGVLTYQRTLRMGPVGQVGQAGRAGGRGR